MKVKSMTLLKTVEVSEMLGITKTALHALRRRESSFPQPIRLSPKVLRWDKVSIDKWLKSRKGK